MAARILTLLDRAAGDANAGRVFAAETGFLLERGPDTVRAPDAAFVTRERVERTGPVPGFWPGPPDLAVEVVSPGDTYSQLHEKALAWLRAGARLVLVADPAGRDVTLYRTPAEAIVLTGDELVDCSTVLSGCILETCWDRGRTASQSWVESGRSSIASSDANACAAACGLSIDARVAWVGVEAA